MNDIVALPIWNHPESVTVPHWIEIRRGEFEDYGDTIVVLNSEHEIFVNFPFKDFSVHRVQTAINMIGGAIFDREHPGLAVALIFRKAEMMATGRPLSTEEARMLERMEELSA